MKLLLIAFMLLALQSNGQVTFSAFDQNRVDTIPTILLCADTSRINTIELRDGSGNEIFRGLTTPIGGFTMATTFMVVGYRVAGNIIYQITSKKQLIDGLTYLDDKKRPLPKSFIVLSFVDRKQ